MGHEEIYEKLIDIFNLPEDKKDSKLMLQSLLIPQRDEDTILRKFSQNQFRDMINLFLSGFDTGKKMSDLQKEIDKINDNLKSSEIEQKNLIIQIKDQTLKLQSNQQYLQELKEFISLYENGKLNSIINEFQKNKNTQLKINRLYSKRTGLYDKEFKVKKKLNQLDRYFDKKLIESIEETLNPLICPVCENNFKSDSLESRIKNNKCPYCNSEAYDGSLYDLLDGRIKEAKDEKDGLLNNLKEIEKEKTTTEEEIEKIKKQIPVLVDLNPVITRVLDKGYSEEKLKEKYIESKADVIKMEKIFEDSKNSISDLNKKIKELIDNDKNLKTIIDKTTGELEQLNKDHTQKNLQEFSKLLNETFQELTKPDKYILELRNGRIFLKTALSEKDCTKKTDLSYSQKKLIDIALWVTILKLNLKHNKIKLNFTLIDDIFENLDNQDVKWKDNVISLIKDQSKLYQTIIFTTSTIINNKLNYSKVINLIHQTNIMDFVNGKN